MILQKAVQVPLPPTVLPTHKHRLRFTTARRRRCCSQLNMDKNNCEKYSRTYRTTSIQQLLVVTAMLLSSINYVQYVQSFVTVTVTVAPVRKQQPRTFFSPNAVLAKKEETWSKSGRQSSRFGVRKRVKAVLEKAKNRTGLTNRNSDASVVAETASIGGFYYNADLIRKNGYDSDSNSNGSSNNYRNGAEEEETETNSNNNVFTSFRNATDVDLILQSSYNDNNNIDNGNNVKKNGEIISNDKNIEPNRNGTAKPTSSNNNKIDVDVVLNAGKVEPLPFTLPKLTPIQEQLLNNGERIQEQSKMGREGSGYVVFDVQAPDWLVWECLLDFEKYPEYIGTVRSMRMFTNTHLKQSYIAEKPVLPGTDRETRHYGIASTIRARFVLSKFHLNIAAVHKYRPHPAGHYMEFTLDKACKNVVLQDAKGIWYTQMNPNGKEGYTRVWLLCELSVSPMLPTFIVDYAAKRAMPRASTWVTPTVNMMKKEFNL